MPKRVKSRTLSFERIHAMGASRTSFLLSRLAAALQEERVTPGDSQQSAATISAWGTQLRCAADVLLLNRGDQARLAASHAGALGLGG
jgi:hypothetical protein